MIHNIANVGVPNLTLDRPSHGKLLIQVRRATGTGQLKVLERLIRKYPKQAQKMSKEAEGK